MEAKLGDIFTIGSGGTPSKRHPEYYDGDIPWVRTGDLKKEYITKVDGKISEEGLYNSSTRMYAPGTVLIAMYGATIGAVSILKIDACTNQACAAFPQTDKVIPEYLYYFLLSQKQRFINDGVGGAQPNISATYLKNVSFELLGRDAQNNIVQRLNTVKSIIDKRHVEINNLDTFIKARFAEMFGDPIINPKGFPVYRMDEVVDFQGGSQPDKNYFEYEKKEDNIRLIQIRDYKTDQYKTYIPKRLAKRFCTADDIMIGRYGPPIFQILQGIEGSFNVALMKATSKKGRREYIRQFLKQDCLLHYLEGMSKRTAGQDGIQMDKLKAYPVPLPPETLQTEFEKTKAQVDQTKATIQSSLNEAQTLFDSLMQKYFG